MVYSSRTPEGYESYIRNHRWFGEGASPRTATLPSVSCQYRFKYSIYLTIFATVQCLRFPFFF